MGKQKTTEQFINDAKAIHKNKYDYSQTIYYKAIKPVEIICHIKDPQTGEEHGVFQQTPNGHLSGRGCPKCGLLLASQNIKKACEKNKGKAKRKPRSKKEMVAAIKEKCKSRYGTDKINYVDSKTKVTLTCPLHGDFLLTPINIIYGNQGCPICANAKRAKSKLKTTEDFIMQANKVHSNFYNYEKTIYIKARKNTTITCPVHGDFQQTPDNHLKGCGCPSCQNSMLENEVRRLLDDNNIEYIQYYRPEWLKTDAYHSQSLDFYLPKENIAIECQGIQHLKPCYTFGSKTITPEEFYKDIIQRDDRKNKLCKEHGLKIIYFTKIKIDNYRYSLYTNNEDLLNTIKHAKK